MTALLELDQVSVSLPGGGGFLPKVLTGDAPRFDILDKVSLAVGPGETYGLVGESGSGKTTLARAMLGLMPISGGTVKFRDETLETGSSMQALRRHAAMMFQDAVASLSPRMSVGALVTEPLVIHGVAMKDRRAKAEELLGMVGLAPEMARRFPHELSGGQARRVGVARALALEPEIIVADEPTAGLDVSVQGEILNLLNGLKQRLGLSYLIITHNLALVRHVADRIGVMYLGRLIESGPTREVFAEPRHPYTQSLIASVPKPDPRKRRAHLAITGEIPSVLRRPQGCEFHTRCRFVRDICRKQAPALRDIAPGHAVRCHFADDPTIITGGLP